MPARLALLAATLLLLVACETTPVTEPQPEKQIHVVDPDAVVARFTWVVTEDRKAAASIVHMGTNDTERYEGQYFVYDIRTTETGEICGKIDAESGIITSFREGLDRNETRTTNERVNVTTKDGLTQAARFLLKLQGGLEIYTAGEYSRRAK